MVKRIAWTPASWECFKNNCECNERCSNYSVCKYIANQTPDSVPPIKGVVLELIENGVAIPMAVTDYQLNFMTSESIEVLKMWLVDGLTKSEIAKQTGLTERAVQERIVQAINKFDCNYDSYYKAGKGRAFREWAKENLVPEIKELEREGLICSTLK